MRTTIVLAAFILSTSVTAQAGLLAAKTPQSTTVAAQPVPLKPDTIRQLGVPDPAGVAAPPSQPPATAPETAPPSAARPSAAQQQAMRRQQLMQQRKMQQAKMMQMKRRQMQMSDDDDDDDDDRPKARRGSAKMKTFRSVLDD
jgi:hypothetical protein